MGMHICVLKLDLAMRKDSLLWRLRTSFWAVASFPFKACICPLP
jgi:hypothetical protein